MNIKSTNKLSQIMTFRLSSKGLFLTYSQCPVSPKDALTQLETKLSNIEEYVVAQEEHKDEGKHLHCWLKLNKACNIKDQKKLDLILEGVPYHGKYEACKSNAKVLKYVTKDGNFISSKPLEELELQV